MSEQIREQVSAFLDGELRGSFGRYALIGEALRGPGPLMAKGFAARVNFAIDGEPLPANGHGRQVRAPHWWRPFAGAAVAAGVAVVAVVALQQRAVAPTLRPGAPLTAQSASPAREALSYTVPAAPPAAATAMPPARLTNYVFAHSRYSSGLDQRGVLADMLIEADEQAPKVEAAAAHVAP